MACNESGSTRNLKDIENYKAYINDIEKAGIKRDSTRTMRRILAQLAKSGKNPNQTIDGTEEGATRGLHAIRGIDARGLSAAHETNRAIREICRARDRHGLRPPPQHQWICSRFGCNFKRLCILRALNSAQRAMPYIGICVPIDR